MFRHLFLAASVAVLLPVAAARADTFNVNYRTNGTNNWTTYTTTPTRVAAENAAATLTADGYEVEVVPVGPVTTTVPSTIVVGNGTGTNAWYDNSYRVGGPNVAGWGWQNGWNHAGYHGWHGNVHHAYYHHDGVHHAGYHHAGAHFGAHHAVNHHAAAHHGGHRR